jgi:hypothetical protein
VADAGAAHDPNLVREIATQLKIEWQYVRHFDGDQADDIMAVRRAGRAAGELLGRSVRTFRSDPDLRADHKVVVIVYIDDRPENADERRKRARIDVLLRAAWAPEPSTQKSNQSDPDPTGR